MTNRKTKSQKEAAQKAALLQRLRDIYSGALGQEWSNEDFATAEVLSRVLPAVRTSFGIEDNSSTLSHYCLHHYDTPETAAEFLYDQGVRA